MGSSLNGRSVIRLHTIVHSSFALFSKFCYVSILCSCCTIFILHILRVAFFFLFRFFHYALIRSCTIFTLHFFRLLFSLFILFILHFLYVARLPYCPLFMFCYFFHFSCFLCATFFSFLHFFRVALFQYITVSFTFYVFFELHLF